METLDHLLNGFSKLSRADRFDRLLELGFLSQEDMQFLQSGGLQSPELAEHLIENVIGYFQLPLGVATNFNINSKDYMIPMAVEETSIIAAASKTAKWIRQKGKITTRQLGHKIIGQIQLAKVSNAEKTKEQILANKDSLIRLANSVLQSLVSRGGGVDDLSVRILNRSYQGSIIDNSQDSSQMLVVHIYCDPCEAMGANLINQACEALKPYIEEITGESVTMCILSNLVDTKLTEARVEIENIDPSTGKGIEEASLFSQVDPYRASTNNKGVLNGIDPILIATGNDWRAVEAGVHAYACRDGQYRSITEWKMQGSSLVGILRAPIVVGTVGGVTNLHPTAKLALKMLGMPKAEELAGIIASVGLVQNLGALRALSTVGVVQGHMKLHATNLALAAGCKDDELGPVQEGLQSLLQKVKRISLADAKRLLTQYREKSKSEPKVQELR